MAVGSDDTLTVWVNGKQVYNFQDSRGLAAEAARFDVKLDKGSNRILVKCGNHGGPWGFIIALTVPGEYAFLKAPAAGRVQPRGVPRLRPEEPAGDPEHGRALFHDLKGLACIKCHTVGKEGGAVGPELSSIGAKYPRDVLITSVLNPSAQISSGYEPVVVALADGRVLTGIVKSDTAEGLEIEDADAKRIRIAKDDIEERKRSDVSIMPNGLAEGLKPQDFADLISYLETLKDVNARPSGSGSGRSTTMRRPSSARGGVPALRVGLSVYLFDATEEAAGSRPDRMKVQQERRARRLLECVSQIRRANFFSPTGTVPQGTGFRQSDSLAGSSQKHLLERPAGKPEIEINHERTCLSLATTRRPAVPGASGARATRASTWPRASSSASRSTTSASTA